MKRIQGSGTSLIDDYPIKKHTFLNKTENTPLLYNTFYSQPIKVIKIDNITNKVLKIYKSITDAANNVEIDRKGIYNCLNKKQRTSGGFKWEYLK